MLRCCEANYYEQAVGVAMEGRRLDKLEQIITRSNNTVATLSYALGVCQKLVTNRDFRQQVGGVYEQQQALLHGGLITWMSRQKQPLWCCHVILVSSMGNLAGFLVALVE